MATRGVVYVHSAPPALCPHIEWAVGGRPRHAHGPRLDRPAGGPGMMRAELSWQADPGTAARLGVGAARLAAAALRGHRGAQSRLRGGALLEHADARHLPRHDRRPRRHPGPGGPVARGAARRRGCHSDLAPRPSSAPRHRVGRRAGDPSDTPGKAPPCGGCTRSANAGADRASSFRGGTQTPGPAMSRPEPLVMPRAGCCRAIRGSAARRRWPRRARTGSRRARRPRRRRRSPGARSIPPAMRSCSAASSSSSCVRALVVHLGEAAPVQDAYRRDRAHDGDLGARPGEDPGGAERTRVHRDVGAAVGLAGHQRHPRHGGLGEGVQQLGAAADDAVPLLPDAGQVAGDVDDHDQRDTERVAHPHEPRRLLRGGRVEAAAEAQRVVGDEADGAPAEPAQRRHDVGRPPWVQLDAAVLVEQAGDQRMDVVGALGALGSVSARSTSSGSPMSPWSPSSAASRRASS